MPRDCPLVFACSGCSTAGQLADLVARELDRRGLAEMSCLAGVGAAKPLLLKKINGRRVWIVGGCPIECSQGVFDQVQEHVDVHVHLHDLGVQKNAPLPTGAGWDRLLDAVVAYVSDVEADAHQRNE